MHKSCTIDAVSACHPNHSFAVNLVRWGKKTRWHTKPLYAEKEQLRSIEDPSCTSRAQLEESVLAAAENWKVSSCWKLCTRSRLAFLLFMNVFSWKYFTFLRNLHRSAVLYFFSSWNPLLLHLSPSSPWISLSAISTHTSLAAATPGCICPSTIPVSLGHLHCLLLLGWKALLTVSLSGTLSLLIINAFIHSLTSFGVPSAVLNLSPQYSVECTGSVLDASSATLQNELNLFYMKKLIFLLFHPTHLCSKVSIGFQDIAFSWFSSMSPLLVPSLSMFDCLRDQTVVPSLIIFTT